MNIHGDLVSDIYLSSLAKTNAVNKIHSSSNALSPADNTEHTYTQDFQIDPFDKITEAMRNGNDSATLFQKAQQAYDNLSNSLSLLRNIAKSASDENKTSKQRNELNQQAQALIGKLSNSVNKVQYNGARILDQTAEAINVQFRADSDGNVELGLRNMTSIFISKGINKIDLSSEERALTSIDIIDDLASEIEQASQANTESSTRLEDYIDSLSIFQVDAWKSLSPVQDENISSTVSSLMRYQLSKMTADPSAFIQVQANTNKRVVLGLLKM